MKKTAIIATFIFVLGLVVSSCKSYETCPAYGKTKSPLGHTMKY